MPALGLPHFLGKVLRVYPGAIRSELCFTFSSFVPIHTVMNNNVPTSLIECCSVSTESPGYRGVHVSVVVRAFQIARSAPEMRTDKVAAARSAIASGHPDSHAIADSLMQGLG